MRCNINTGHKTAIYRSNNFLECPGCSKIN